MSSIYPTTNYFDNSTPESTAVSITKLNYGKGGFEDAGDDSIKSVHFDGKYWIVEIFTSGYYDEFEAITVDNGTLMSKIDNEEWKSLDELKATYIADIQSDHASGKPQKITINGKEIWKVQTHDNEGYLDPQVEYVYVDLETGKSKNTWKEFNNAAGTNDRLTLKQVDATIDKMGIGPNQFRDALRNLYPA
jgi:hypothetical protein